MATKLGVDPRGCQILLNALVSLDLLSYSQSDARYSLLPASEVHLLQASPDYMGNLFYQSDRYLGLYSIPIPLNDTGSLFLLFHNLNGGRLDRLHENVKHGGAVLDDHAEVPENEFWNHFAKTTAVGFNAPAQSNILPSLPSSFLFFSLLPCSLALLSCTANLALSCSLNSYGRLVVPLGEG